MTGRLWRETKIAAVIAAICWGIGLLTDRRDK